MAKLIGNEPSARATCAKTWLTWKCESLCHVWFCDPVDCSPPGSSVHGILQARILEWVAISFSKGSSWPRDWTKFFHTTGRLFTIWSPREAKTYMKLTRSCLTTCGPMDCSLPGCSIHGILQARILEWVAVPFSRGSSQPRDRTQVSHIAGEFFSI